MSLMFGWLYVQVPWWVDVLAFLGGVLVGAVIALPLMRRMRGSR